MQMLGNIFIPNPGVVSASLLLLVASFLSDDANAGDLPAIAKLVYNKLPDLFLPF